MCLVTHPALIRDGYPQQRVSVARIVLPGRADHVTCLRDITERLTALAEPISIHLLDVWSNNLQASIKECKDVAVG